MARKTFFDESEHFEASTRADRREWLAAHHENAKGVWLVYYKKHTGVPSVLGRYWMT